MKLKVKFSIFGIVLFLIFIFFKNFNLDIRYKKTSKLSTQNVNTIETELELKSLVTIVLKYCNDDLNFFATTINSFLSRIPALTIVLVSDTIIPREIMHNILNTSTVISVPQKLDLLNLVVDRNIANYIKTKYMFIAPVGVTSLSADDFFYLINILNYSKSSFLAVPVEKSLLKCLKLELNLIMWSIRYKHRSFTLDCDAVQGDHGIFMNSKTFKKIGEPFMLPFPEAFYIQATSQNMKVKQTERIILRRIKHKENKNNDMVLKTQFQRQIMNKKLKIKKVIRENGIVEWFGCTRHTERCFPNIINSVPDYINQGRWTPPCCLKVLKETVHHVFKVLHEWNVTFWLEGGSLLGAVRMKNIIPWDYDVDIGVYSDDLIKCPWLEKIHNRKSEKNHLPSIIDDQGFVWEKASPEEGEFYRVQASVHNRLHVDIFPFFPKNGIMSKKTWFPNHPQDKEFPEHYLKPLTTIEFAGIQAPAPNNVKEFLEMKFGKGCVENPQYPDPVLFPFPDQIKDLIVNKTHNYDMSLNGS